MAPFWQKDLFEYLPGWSERPLPLRDIAVICRKLSFMLDAGVSAENALGLLAGQSSGRVKSAVTSVLGSVTRGDGFSAALGSAGVFPKLLCRLVKMGEAAGCLPEVILQAADYYEHRAATENELAGAMVYPLLVGVLMLAVIVMAVTFVLPSYARVFAASGAELPLITQVLLNVSGFFAAYWPVIFIVLSALVLTLAFYFKNSGRALAHGILLRLPLYKKFVNARLAQALSLTLAARQNLTEALPICADIFNNLKVKRDLARALAELSSGVPFHEALGKIKYIDVLLIDMIKVGEETGMLRRTVFKCRAYFDGAYTAGIKSLNKLAEPILTIFLGAVLGALMLAIILPTFRLADADW